MVGWLRRELPLAKHFLCRGTGKRPHDTQPGGLALGEPGRPDGTSFAVAPRFGSRLYFVMSESAPPFDGMLHSSAIIATAGCAGRKIPVESKCQTAKTSQSRGADGTRALRRRDPPKARGRREDRAPAGTHGPRAAIRARGRTTGSAETTRPSPRDGFNGVLRALPGDRALLPPSPLRSLLLKNLAPASGRQDHTAWPSAKRSFVRTLKKECCDPSRPPLPASTFMTIAIRPSARGGMRERCGRFHANAKRNIFYARSGQGSSI